MDFKRIINGLGFGLHLGMGCMFRNINGFKTIIGKQDRRHHSILRWLK